MNDFLGLAVAFGLVLLNAFFVAAEFSLVSVRRSRIETLIEEGNATAKVVGSAIGSLDRYIAATQLGITIASLGLGWVGEPALGHLVEPAIEAVLEPVLHLLPEGASEAISGAAIGGAIAFLIITTLHVVVGELVPKSIALQKPEQTALWIARPTAWATSLFHWPIQVLNGTGNALLRLLGFERTEGHPALVSSVEELRILVHSSEELGVLDGDERDIIDAVFNIRNLLTRQVMVPRTEIYMVSADDSLSELVRHAIETPYTKFPIYDQDADHIIGIVYVKDLVQALASGDDQQTARALAAEPLFVPESLPVVNLLQLLREQGKHIAIVHDEFGGTEGMVTLDDVLGKIVGELPDRYEYDQLHAPEAVQQGDRYLVNGLMLIEDFNEEFGLNLSDENYNTIGGYVMGRLERIPQVGDAVEAEGASLRVEQMDELRIALLRVTLTRPARNEETGEIEARHPNSDNAPA